jgi:hypothetical protein
VGTGGGGDGRLSCVRCKYYLDEHENCCYLIRVLIVCQFGAEEAVECVQYHTIQ